MNVKFSGFGGQGIILAGVIYGHAATLDGKNAVQTQSYGSASRGGACKCDVIISDEQIRFNLHLFHPPWTTQCLLSSALCFDRVKL